MSQENVEIVQALFTAWEQRDPQAALDRVHPDIEVDTTGASWLDASLVGVSRVVPERVHNQRRKHGQRRGKELRFT